MGTVSECFPYLVDTSKATGGGFVSDLRFHPIIKAGQLLPIGGLDLLPFYVEHGARRGMEGHEEPYHCLGFLIEDRLCYLSDISRMPDPTLSLLQTKQIDLLIVDCLRVEPPYKSHYCLADSLGLATQLEAKQTYLVGMTHTMDYRTMQPDLDARTGGTVRMAHDGLRLLFIY